MTSRRPIITPGADDLEENYILDSHVILADSDVEAESVLGEDDGAPPERRVNPIAQPTESDKKHKRKAKEMEQGKLKKRKVESKQESDAPPPPMDNTACQSPSLIAQYIEDKCRRTFKGISQMELEDMLIPATPRLHSRLTQKPQHYGAPTAIFLSGAALRVIDVVKKCRKLPGDKGGEVAKLFAKHIKVQEQIDYLHKTKVSIAIGTPDRIGKLLASKALQTTALTHIVLDASHRDSKNRSILDIPEVAKEVFSSILGFAPLRELVKGGKVQVVLF
ncbi:hypothetical protein FRB96_002362 [Tulasnella sp. 330]|nr:hypothetical protein FRB96_002362 [Tulasnella sp. 330]KAG8879213.1 hypothetical protein FRB97_001880 [Tulasnella sp. 331]KAG8885213.1 hypothetical protein FRB98_001895 [Tulasnella sp. 332]